MMYVRRALDDHLRQMPPGVDVAWPMQQYEPDSQTAWLRPTFLPNQPQAAALGVEANNRWRGIYQIDCFYPKNKAYGAERKAQEIIQRFNRGTYIEYETAGEPHPTFYANFKTKTFYTDSATYVVGVSCWSAGILPRYEESGWIAYPVNIEWVSDVTNELPTWAI